MCIKRWKNLLVLNDEVRIKAIENLFGEKYYIPLGYNNAKSMTRYIETRFIFGEQPFEVESVLRWDAFVCNNTKSK